MTMNIFQGRIDFLKLKNACVINVNGNTGGKRGVFIPIEDNNIFVSTDESNKAKGAYFNFAVFENKHVSKYGDTHLIKQSIDKDTRFRMSEEERRAMPILGNMKPIESNNTQHKEGTTTTYASREEETDSLPF